MKFSKKVLHFSNFSKWLILLLIFLSLIYSTDTSGVRSRLVPSGSSHTPKTINIERTIRFVTPTPKPFSWTVEKISEHETKLAIPPDPRMATPDELFEAMNSYRRAHNIPTIGKNETLCKIAQSRANEQLANGGLDNHAGFDKYAQEQNEFSTMGEVLFGGNQPQYAVHIIEFGWDRSLTGHKEAIMDPSWQQGCGGIAGYYAVFIFGSK